MATTPDRPTDHEAGEDVNERSIGPIEEATKRMLTEYLDKPGDEGEDAIRFLAGFVGRLSSIFIAHAELLDGLVTASGEPLDLGALEDRIALVVGDSEE